MQSGLIGSGGERVALLGVDVRAEVVAGHACATVRQRYRNDETKPIEAIYTFPLPTKAILTGFSMTVAGRRLDGEVHEREEAFRRYDDAISAGHGGALLEQERPNVFTANVGNLLPGEETIIEIQYVEPVLADEGAVRWTVPTLVAPRYIPGVPGGDRSAHGTASPTNQVPDADRISPPIGAVSYGLALDLVFDLGVALEVESPSHAVVVNHEGDKARVTFSQREVPLDRDVVVTAFAKNAMATTMPIASAVTHRSPATGKPGTLALTLIPDLGNALRELRSKSPKAAARGRRLQSDVVFVLDRSGSMGGSSMTEARTALRLCLRQLREGDRFDILAFDESIESFAGQMTPFGQSALQRADAWLAQVDARGGTELLAPMLEAAKLAPDGLVIVLTDGQVGNEDEILAAFMDARKSARVISFGIGTNVSDALLAALAEKTGGTVEMIHPGERLDEKVIAQFARATAPRVTDVTIKTRGIELGEIAPSEARPLIDGEPYCVFATYEEPGRGAVEIRGKLDGEPFYLDVAVDLADAGGRPVVAKLWAQARIRDLERAGVVGRRADAMKDRIIKLAMEHGVSSKFTSFVVVEKRTGDRRVNEQAQTRVVPVAPPAGWSLFQASRQTRAGGRRMMSSGIAPMPARAMSMPAAPAPAAAAPSFDRARAIGGVGTGGFGASTAAPPPPAAFDDIRDDADYASAPARPRAQGHATRVEKKGAMKEYDTTPARGQTLETDPVLAILGRQTASGLWEEPGRDAVVVTVDALLALLRLGLTTSHAVYGAQLKKAVDALLERLGESTTPALELALGVAWLVASGRRTRQTIEVTARARGSAELVALIATLRSGDEPAVRAHVDRLSPA
jgi:Ca-activated chloride channel homolog